MTGLAGEELVLGQVLGVGVRVIDRQRQGVGEIGVGGELDAGAAGMTDVDALDERRRRDGREGDEVAHVVLKVRESQPDALAPQLLVRAEVVGEARLRLQADVREAREEEVVERRGPEAGASAATDAGPPLLDQVGQ